MPEGRTTARAPATSTRKPGVPSNGVTAPVEDSRSAARASAVDGSDPAPSASGSLRRRCAPNSRASASSLAPTGGPPDPTIAHQAPAAEIPSLSATTSGSTQCPIASSYAYRNGSPARTSHLNPVSVSTWRPPRAGTSSDGSREDTIVDATTGATPAPPGPADPGSGSRSRWSASTAPVSSPSSIRQRPPGARNPTAQRSASGSNAIATSASISSASRSSRAVVAARSGLGESTVGKSGSGAAWSPTMVTSRTPIPARTRRQISPPTPWTGVSATRGGRAGEGRPAITEAT